MIYKTLILKKDTELQEFYGCNSLKEWFSSEKPINFMSESTTWEDIKRIYPEKDFSNIDLIQVEIKILKEQNLEKNKEEDYSPYCPICDGCGEDGCCPATVCEHHLEGVYCETYLKELKFGYIMYNDILNLVDGDKKYDKKIDEIFDKNWDSIFLKNKENE